MHWVLDAQLPEGLPPTEGVAAWPRLPQDMADSPNAKEQAETALNARSRAPLQCLGCTLASTMKPDLLDFGLLVKTGIPQRRSLRYVWGGYSIGHAL